MDARDHDEHEYIIGINFCPYNMEKKKPTKFANHGVFYEFWEFLAKLARPLFG